MKITVLFALIVISISGCCSGRTTNQVFIRDTTYIKVPDLIQGEGTPQIVTDTIIKYSELKGVDTVIQISYLPQKNVIKYVIKPDTVRFQVRDTLYNTKIEKEVIETTMMSKIGIFFLGALAALIIFMIIGTRNNDGDKISKI